MSVALVAAILTVLTITIRLVTTRRLAAAATLTSTVLALAELARSWPQ